MSTRFHPLPGDLLHDCTTMPPILIDTDPGLDDALALLYAWADPAARVVALTTVSGNVPLDVATTNLLRLLALRAPEPAPRIAAGADRPLVKAPVTAVRYHGADGLGDVGGWPPVDIATVPRDGVGLIAETARHAAPDFVLVTLGPLTNLALAIERDIAALAHAIRARSTGRIYGYIGFVLGALFVALLLVGVIYG